MRRSRLRRRRAMLCRVRRLVARGRCVSGAGAAFREPAHPQARPASGGSEVAWLVCGAYPVGSESQSGCRCRCPVVALGVVRPFGFRLRLRLRRDALPAGSSAIKAGSPARQARNPGRVPLFRRNAPASGIGSVLDASSCGSRATRPLRGFALPDRSASSSAGTCLLASMDRSRWRARRVGQPCHAGGKLEAVFRVQPLDQLGHPRHGLRRRGLQRFWRRAERVETREEASERPRSSMRAAIGNWRRL